MTVAICGKGTDNFTDNTFSSREWSAPTLHSVKEIRERLESFALPGRRIKRMRMIGMSYYHTRDRIEETAYRQLEHLTDAERQLKSDYPTIDPGMQFPRCAEIDEPLLIEFEEGDVFEAYTPQEPEFRMSMNCIPWHIAAGTNQPNVEADILFSPCIGQEIAAYEVNTYMADKDPMYRGAFDEPRELVSNVTLRLKNGLGLQISPYIDFCEVSCVDANNDWVKISFSELKGALFNWDDLHYDESTGFEAASCTLFFGEKGAKHVQEPCITLSSSGRPDSRLHIYVEDFLVLDWCISLAVGGRFDEFGEYHFTHDEWYAILHDADMLLSVESFDILFDELIERQGKQDYMLRNLNSHGAAFWANRGKYTAQINDLRKWSDIVLYSDCGMDICGF